MTIPERQLQTWSHQGAKAQSAATYATIKAVLEDPRAPYASREVTVVLQGSYGNDTNVYADSEVDIVICLTSTFYANTDELSEADKARYEASRSPTSYGFQEFKKEVTDWLTYRFGVGVRAGKKAIFVPGNGTRRDADVLACARHRRFRAYSSAWSQDYQEGICFWTSAGTHIINFSTQHAENCTSKHQATYGRFKPNVRMLKNMRNAMRDKGYIAEGVAPSYFLEGMLWNVPNRSFTSAFGLSFVNALGWLDACDPAKLVCANNLHWLIRDGAPVCWNRADYLTFRRAVRQFWVEW